MRHPSWREAHEFPPVTSLRFDRLRHGDARLEIEKRQDSLLVVELSGVNRGLGDIEILAGNQLLLEEISHPVQLRPCAPQFDLTPSDL
jgi:hypothetical protein